MLSCLLFADSGNMFFLFLSCHLVTVPPGPALADALRSSPVVHGEDGYTPAGGFGSGFDDVDPNLDPELALVSWF